MNVKGSPRPVARVRDPVTKFFDYSKIALDQTGTEGIYSNPLREVLY